MKVVFFCIFVRGRARRLPPPPPYSTPMKQTPDMLKWLALMDLCPFSQLPYSELTSHGIQAHDFIHSNQTS